MHWQWIALGYVTYLAVVSTVRPKFSHRKPLLWLIAVLAWSTFGVMAALGASEVSTNEPIEVVLPALVLVGGYWLSGLLFIAPDQRIEGWLRAVDDALLVRSGVLAWFRRSPQLLGESLELSYLLVYVLVPAGAVTLAAAGHGDQVDRFWTVVLLAEFVCYGMLPWIQTRPPRLVESIVEPAPRVAAMRRLNLEVVDRVSIQANTVPSGHAAGAMATALAVGSTMPVAGAAFLLLALGIAASTVLGRYHYLVDSLLGALVAVVVWSLV